MMPPLSFELATAARIVFGVAASREVGLLAAPFGRRALVVHGRSPARASGVIGSLADHGIESHRIAVDREPTVAGVRAAVTSAAAHRPDLVVAVGGGSVMDTGKAVAALLTNEPDPSEYLELIGRGRAIANVPLPLIAVPTTAGSGSEVTRNAVLESTEHRVKVSMRSPLMLPRLAVVDPGLTCDLPPSVTAATGLDALTQLIEPYVSIKANPVTDGFCVEGMRRVARALQRAYENGSDLDARTDMSLAALLGGLALANAGLGGVHGLAGPMGGLTCAPHGSICAALLPHVVEANLRALRDRQPDSPALARYDEIARLLTGRPTAAASDCVTWLKDLHRSLAVPGLRALVPAGGPPLRDSEGHPAYLAIEPARHSSSMRGNPIELTRDELREIVEQAM